MSGIAALLTRLFVDGFFMNTGWSKMHNLADFATRDRPVGHSVAAL
jgi:hypothetical protein